MTERTVRFIALLSVSGLVTACEAVKSSNPLSPSVAGPIPGVVISQPKLLEPGPHWELDNTSQPVRLLIENASTNGKRPLTYTFQVASDVEFNNLVFSRGGVLPGDAGRTSIQMADRLPTGRPFFWRARAEDGANTGDYSPALSFSIITPVEIDVPATLAPVGGAKIDSTKPTFRIGSGARSGPTGQIVYTIQIAGDQAFSSLVAVYNTPEQGAETRFDPPLELPHNQTFYWRVRAYDSGPSGVIGGWSGTQSFRTPAEPPPPAPSPSPSPSPGPAPGGPCTSTSPLSIVQCERAKYGTPMSSSQLLSLMRAIARDLNANGVGGGPYGILRKGGGHNCGGYSCDIVCAGQGNDQRQWDALSDAEGAASPVWSGPFTLPNIRVDVCEIQ